MATTPGKPSFQTPTSTDDLRSLQQTINAIRERLGNLDAALAAIVAKVNGSTTATDVKSLQQQFSALSGQVTAVQGTAAVAALQTLLAGADGIVVLSHGELVTRKLVAGANVSITYPDGVDGNPVISVGGVLGGATYPLRGIIFAAPQAMPQQMAPRIFHRVLP